MANIARKKMYSEEKKKETLDILCNKAGGNVSKCAKITGINRKTIVKWQQQQACTPEESDTEPSIADIRHRIIRRVGQLVETCTDPKKLMATYQAMSKHIPKSEQANTTFFDMMRPPK